MDLIQQSPSCSDFDVVLGDGGTPAFRVLLPERVLARGLHLDRPLHVLPGDWTRRGESLCGTFRTHTVECRVSLIPEASVLRVAIDVTNLGQAHLGDVWADICAGVNHLPGNPGWCNRDFVPGIALDRTLQGKYWYESVTPRGLGALVGRRWVRIHPNPTGSNADSVPPYFSLCGRRPSARACACRALAGSPVLFQAWKGPARYVTPFPGNACMHMRPFLARKLESGSTASITGVVGMHEGDFRSLGACLPDLLE